MAAVIEWFTSPQGVAVLALLVPFVSSLAAVFFKDNEGVMKVVNLLALNVGKAKNDASAQ